jgi:MFS family permease
VTQRDAIPLSEIASVTAKRYPRRAILGLSLFIGQAFLYNAVTFDLGTILHQFFDVGSSQIPYYMVVFAAGNFLGPLILGRLFDTVGRIPMIAGTYLGSAAVVVALGLLLRSGGLTTWEFMALVLGAFFLASAGASSAYLTVSEIFPMETRALAIALFYAVGTAIGGISGPLLFGQFIHSGNPEQVATGFFIGAGAMALGGITELLFGVRAEGRSLEDIATPLSAEQADRIHARAERERQGLRRFRPGPGAGQAFSSPGMLGTAGGERMTVAGADAALDREVELIAAVVAVEGVIGRDELALAVQGRSWGPGRFRGALREALREGRTREMAHNAYGPPGA